MLPHITTPLSLQAFPIEPLTVLIPGQQSIPPFTRKMIRLVDGHPHMSMPTPKVIRRPIARLMPGEIGIVMEVIRMLGHAFIDQWVLGGSTARLPVMSPGDHMPHMPDHGIDKK